MQGPDETGALEVELDYSDSEISLRAGDVELGNWPLTAVTIEPIDSTSFEFLAEGDRLLFTPNDPATFAVSPLVGARAEPTGTRRGRKSKRKSDDVEQTPVPDQASRGGMWRRGRRSAEKEPPEETSSEPSPEDQEDAEAAVAEAPIDPRPAPAEPITGAADDEQPPADPAASDVRSEPNGTASPGPKEGLSGAWLRALDTARKYDLFDLNRVPIDEDLRGQEHEHTWDHRVAASSGLGKRICTICGRIRR